MKNAAIGVALFFMAATHATAEGWEIALLAGWTAPTFEEQFVFSPEIDLPNIPGGRIRQSGDFSLSARGSFAFGGSVSYFFNENIGIQGRIDTVDVEIETLGPQFRADIELPAPLPPARAELDVGTGVVNVERLFPMSFNVVARTSGAARFVASGGISYLPRVQFDARQPVALRVDAFGIPLAVSEVLLGASALSDTSENRWGFNGGAGLEVQVAPNVAVVGELRVHRFDAQTFEWNGVTTPVTPLDEVLLDELEMLPPIEVELITFQVTGGVSIRF